MERKREGTRRRSRAAAAGLLAMLLLAAALAGCSASDSAKSAGSAANSAAPMADMSAEKLNAKQAAPAAAQAAGGAAEKKDSATSLNAGQTAADLGDGFNRKIMYRANLVMQTDNYTEARAKVQELVALSGGYILQFNENTNSGEKGGNFTIKVPAGGFVSLMDQLEKISPTSQRNVQGQDVSEEYVDLQSRLKAKQVVETRLLAFMEKATKTDELLAFSNELAKVQEEIERFKGRMRYIDQNVAMSTIELRLYQKAEAAASLRSGGASPFGKRIAGAFDFSLAAAETIIQGIIVLLVGALPIVLLLAVVAVPVVFYVRRKNRKLADIRKRVLEQNGFSAKPKDEIDENETQK